MKRLVGLVCLCIVLSGCTAIKTQKPVTAPESVNSLEDKVYALRLLWSEIKYNFVNLDRLDFDVDSLYRETMRRVVVTENDEAYYRELDQFLATFNDGHTQMCAIPDSDRRNVDYPQYGTRLFGDKFYFITYRLNSDTDPRLLGAEVIEIEGVPAMEYAEKNVMPGITASTDKYRRNLSGLYLLNGAVGTYIKGKALRPDGEIIEFNVIRDGEKTRTPEEQYWMPESKGKKSRGAIQCDWVDDIAVLTINRFRPEEMSGKIDSVMTLIKSRQPAGLIIDLRGNGGGSTDVAIRLQTHLTNLDSMRMFGSQTRNNLGYGRAQGNYRKEYEDYFKYRSYETFPAEVIARDKGVEPVQCPVVVLIGPYSFSACEDFLVNIYEMPDRPLLIGEETAGSTGAPLVIQLPHEAVARICTLRILYPYSLEPFVNKGVQPDIKIEPTLEDYFSGTDPVMAKALDVLEKNDSSAR